VKDAQPTQGQTPRASIAGQKTAAMCTTSFSLKNADNIHVSDRSDCAVLIQRGQEAAKPTQDPHHYQAVLFCCILSTFRAFCDASVFNALGYFLSIALALSCIVIDCQGEPDVLIAIMRAVAMWISDLMVQSARMLL
jgi:hypothetical protein